ncbi:hypothetical protein JCM16358_00950 [Halanaerocella petrolearia]
MKRLIAICSIITTLFLFTGTSLAFTTPEVSYNHGVVTGMIISDNGLTLEGKYGLTSEIALIGEFGDYFSRIGGKYQVGPSLALVAGITEDSPFLGINGARMITNDLTGVYEVDLSTYGHDLSVHYDLGVKLDLDNQVDLRAGLDGFIGNEHFTGLKIGVGYKF